MSVLEGHFGIDVSALKAVPAPHPPMATKQATVFVKDHNAHNDDHTMDDDPALLPGPSALPSETSTQLSRVEHILMEPDSHIGSVSAHTSMMWVWDSESKRMVNREITYVPGFYKIVDEILVNAANNKINDSSMDTIKVNIDVENNSIFVYNNGHGVPIEMHPEENVYIPELIFGRLLSSSSYDDDNGAKLANIYSTEFTVEIADRNQRYVQTWTENMSKMGKAEVLKSDCGEDYTRVTFKPDLKRFGVDTIDGDTVALLKKRVYDLAGTVQDVNVFLNDERLEIENFRQYVELFLSSAAESDRPSDDAEQPTPTVIYEAIDDRWEVALGVSDGTFQQVSFANSVCTSKGGTHVNYIANQLAKTLATSISMQSAAVPVNPTQIKNHMWIFVNARIENPTFDSPNKEVLTLAPSKFGSEPRLSEDFVKQAATSPVVNRVLQWARRRADKRLKKMR